MPGGRAAQVMNTCPLGPHSSHWLANPSDYNAACHWLGCIATCRWIISKGDHSTCVTSLDSFLFIGSVLVCGAVSALLAQSPGQQAKTAPTPACALLSVAEIRKITGRANYPDHVDGDPLGEGAGGGSSCQYGGQTMVPGDYPPMLSFVLIPGKG